MFAMSDYEERKVRRQSDAQVRTSLHTGPGVAGRPEPLFQWPSC